MGDFLDKAQETEEMYLRQALEAQRRRTVGANASASDWKVLSATDCEGEAFGEPIPNERRRAIPGVRLCVECAERQERRKR